MTTTEKNAEISRRILEKVTEGLELRDAIDAVLGEGQFEAIVADIYEALRAN